MNEMKFNTEKACSKGTFLIAFLISYQSWEKDEEIPERAFPIFLLCSSLLPIFLLSAVILHSSVATRPKYSCGMTRTFQIYLSHYLLRICIILYDKLSYMWSIRHYSIRYIDTLLNDSRVFLSIKKINSRFNYQVIDKGNPLPNNK